MIHSVILSANVGGLKALCVPDGGISVRVLDFLLLSLHSGSVCILVGILKYVLKVYAGVQLIEMNMYKD